MLIIMMTNFHQETILISGEAGVALLIFSILFLLLFYPCLFLDFVFYLLCTVGVLLHSFSVDIKPLQQEFIY